MAVAFSHHVVRLTIRIGAGEYARSIDLSIPLTSTFSEVLPEIAKLIDVPETTRPWEFTTAAGAPLDPHTPLSSMRLRDGQVLAMRPQEPVDPPVVRDAAESLAVADNIGPRSGIDVLAAVGGASALGVLTGSLTNVLFGLAATAVASLVVGVVSRSQVVVLFGALAAGLASGSWVAGGEGWTWPINGSTALGLIVGAFTSMFLSAATRFLPAVAAAAFLLVVGAIGAWMPADEAPFALTVLAGLVTVMLTPAVATRAAGLKIPRVPTAGQEFEIADDYQDDVGERADSARRITDGLGVGTAMCMVPALVLVAMAGGSWVFAFCLCTAGALLVHAARHHATVPRVSMAVAAVTAVFSGVLAVAVSQDPHPVLVVVAGLVAVAAASAAVWAQRVPDLEPTTLVWVERAEAAAIIAVIPLAFYLTGIFETIRGI